MLHNQLTIFCIYRFSRTKAEDSTSYEGQTRSSQFYNPVNIKIHGDTKCPSMSDIMTEQSFEVCPAYYVTEYDENRIPLVIFQVCSVLSLMPKKHLREKKTDVRRAFEINSDLKKVCQ